MEYNLKYFNSFIPSKWEHEMWFKTSDVLKHCLNKHQHISSSIVSDPANLFPLPIVLQCLDERDKNIYLHVYGLRKTVYLRFHNDNKMTWRKSDVFTFVHNTRKTIDIDIVDAKIVHKTPIEGACMGQCFFLKLYTGKYVSWYKLKSYLEENETFSSEIHNRITTPYNIWMTHQDAYPLGMLSVRNAVETKIRKSDTHIDQHVYYQDIQLHSYIDYPLDLTTSSDLYDQILTDVIYPIFVESTFYSKHTKQIINSVSFDKNVLYISQKDDCIVWNWKRIKEWFLHRLFFQLSNKPGKTNILYEDEDKFDSAIFRLYNTLSIGKPSNDDIFQIFKDLTILQGELRRKLKKFWHQFKSCSPEYLSRIQKKEEEHIQIAKTLTCLSFDIETDFEPHIQKEETVTCIVAILFNHLRDTRILEYQIFLRLSEENSIDQHVVQHQLNTNIDQILYICFNNLEDKKNKIHFNFNAVPGKNVFLQIFNNELSLIRKFTNYVKKKNVKFITGFNSNRFDFPFLENRLAILESKGTYVNLKSRPTYFCHLKCTHKNDKGYIKYRRKKKTNDDHYCSDEIESDSDFEVTDIWCDMNDIDVINKDKEVKKSKPFSFLTACRDIANIDMNTIIIADMMLLVGNRQRGCKLDDVCHETFGVTKVHNEKVSYANLCKTWKSGEINDLCLLIGYCMRDVVLLYMLAKAKGIMLFTASMAIETGLQLRELFAQEAVKTVCSLFLKYGHVNDIILCDTNKYEPYILKPVKIFDPEKDFSSLQPCGGRSVLNAGCYDSWQVTYDFSGQYPCIMIGRNICLSSILDKSFIDRNQLIENKDFIKVRISNVYQLYTGPCLKHKGKNSDCNGKHKECNFHSEIKIVHKTLYYATDSYFKAYCNTISDILKQKRKIYKDLVKTNTDPAEIDKNKAREQAVKLTANSVYGVLVKMNPCVGGTVTHFGRKDIAEVARIAYHRFGYPVVTGFTDSVFLTILNKNETANFSSMCKALKIPSTSSVHDIIIATYKKADDFAKFVNEGCKERNIQPLYPHPSKICVEKLFPSLVILAKQCYIGYKIMPDSLAVKLHITGISGKRADTTIIKTKSQLLIYKMFQRKDFKGLVMFMHHLFLFTCRELHVENMIENEKKKFSMNNDHKGIEEYAKKIKPYCKSYAGNIPLNLLTSYEKVGDLSKMNTSTTQKAALYCFENGMALHNAPMFIAIQRGSNVQVTNFMQGFIEVILSGPINKSEVIKKIYTDKEITVWHRHERKMPDQKNKQIMSKVNKLDVTTMPQNYVSRAENRTSIQSDIFYQLKDLLLYMHFQENDHQKYRNDIFKNKSCIPPCEPILFEERSISQKNEAKNRLLHFITNVSEIECHAPIYMFDINFAISKLCELLENVDNSYVVNEPHRSVLLWHLYIDYLMSAKCPKQYLIIGKHVTSGHLQIIFSNQPPADCEEFTYNMNSLTLSNVKCIGDGECQYFLNMHLYRNQTCSTPAIVESYDGKNMFLANHDSYIPCEENSLSFRTEYNEMVKVLHFFPSLKIDSPEILRLEIVINKLQIKITVSKKVIKVPIIKILRDDEIPVMTGWLWDIAPIYVNAAWFLYNVYDVIRKQPHCIDFKCSRKQNYVKIKIQNTERLIHATDGLVSPEKKPPINAFNKMMSSQRSRRKIEGIISSQPYKKAKK
jgi:DNA polymerase elongation subunit (family B)